MSLFSFDLNGKTVPQDEVVKLARSLDCTDDQIQELGFSVQHGADGYNSIYLFPRRGQKQQENLKFIKSFLDKYGVKWFVAVSKRYGKQVVCIKTENDKQNDEYRAFTRMLGGYVITQGSETISVTQKVEKVSEPTVKVAQVTSRVSQARLKVASIVEKVASPHNTEI